MRKHIIVRTLGSLLLALLAWPGGVVDVQGQFAPKRDTIKVNPSSFPADIQKGYQLFRTKCNECHGLDTSLKPMMTAGQWTFEVKSMQAMPSSQFNDAQAKAIVDFLSYYEAHRESPPKSTDQAAAASGIGGPGHQFYDAQGCATCHAIGGTGGNKGPALSDIGKRLSKDQLTAVIQELQTGKSSSMPPLPSGTTDQQVKDLVDFLLSLGGDQQKQGSDGPQKQKTDQGQKPNAAEPKERETATGNQPVVEAGAAAAGGAGRDFYTAQRCDRCHAIGGKGGSSGPPLSDVGKRLSKEQLTAVIQKIQTGKSTSMPPLPAGTTDEQVKDLVDFLASLGSAAETPNDVSQKQTTVTSQKENAGAPKQPEEPTDNKPVAQIGAVVPGGAGRQFYDTQRCDKCHAMGGKGGTSGPNLSDVGKRLSKDQLTAVVQKIRTGKSASMPPLPPGTTDQQVSDLVNFLENLGRDKPRQSATAPREPATLAHQQPPRALDSQPSKANLNLLVDEKGDGSTALPGTLLLFLIAVTAVLIGIVVFRPGVTATAAGKILAFFGLFLLPIICAGMGTTYHIDRSKSTKFCLSCHEMEPFGKSLLVDDPQHLAAAHFQNHRVPADEACYTCHTNYAMFGGFRAKMGGLKHVYVHYLGKPPAPEAIRLYEPFNNRECLHCHLGARSFEEGVTHNAKPYLLAAVKGNQVSCLSIGCHQTVHNVAESNDVKFWQGRP